METKFNFKSQIATSREQSERLLALGLKKETADMFYRAIHNGNKVVGYRVAQGYNYKHFEVFADDIPAWSLHRLMILAEMEGTAFSNLDVAYEATISIIAAKIRFGYFNKEYLENGK